MRTVVDPADLAGAVRAARSEAGAAFGDAAVYLERRLTRPRHIEVQLLGDQHGTVLPFVERECSIQRRHQKVVEETPSLAVTPDAAPRARRGGRRGRARGRLHQRRHDRVPARRGRPVLLPRDEHAAAGRASDHRDGDRARSRAVADPHRARRAARPRSRSARSRRRATRSSAGSTPRIRTTAFCRRRAAFSRCARRPDPGIRDDSGATAGLDVPIFYDPMISKLIAWAEDRPRAIARMRRALGEYVVAGIRTTMPFFTWLLEQPDFVAGRFHTTFLDELLASRNGRPFVEPTPEVEEIAAMAAALQAMLSPGAVAASTTGAAIDAGMARWKDQARLEGLEGLGGLSRRAVRDRSGRAPAARHGQSHGRRFCSQRRWTPPSRRCCAHRRAHPVADRGQRCGVTRTRRHRPASRALGPARCPGRDGSGRPSG